MSNDHWSHVDNQPQDVTKPPTMEAQMAEEGRDCLQILVGSLLIVALILASITGHAAVSANYIP